MAHVYYAMSGEGRGHATRARTVIEALRRQHRVTVFAYHQAQEMLAPVYRGTEVAIRTIPGLNFRYTDRGRLNYPATLLASVPFVAKLPSYVREMRRRMERDAPALAITDFEPIVPRAARACGIPFISLDHQHFLTAYDLRSLPFKLRAYAALLSPAVHAFYRGQLRTIVSSFYSPPLRKALADVSRVGVLLRPEVLRESPARGRYLVAYLRRHAPARVLDALRGCGEEVRVYGLGRRPPDGNLRFRDVHMFGFVEDLVGCRALVSTAGNQVVGEALYLHKPVLALPEVGNFEQEINGHFLAASGAGTSASPLTLTPEQVRGFVASADALREQIDAPSVCGNSTTLALIEHHLRQIEYGEAPIGSGRAGSPKKSTALGRAENIWPAS